MSRIYIDGNTYPVKEQLKAIGCRWDKERRAWYADSSETADKARKIVKPHPVYNSPPPKDLGTVDPVELASKYGRTAVAGATVISFTAYGLIQGDNGQKDGSIHKIKGRRYVQVARTARRYCSRDWLDDMDLFDAQPGGSYQWDGVEVESTSEELAADAERKAKREAPKIATEQWNAVVRQITQAVEQAPEWVTATPTARWHAPVMCHTGAYPEIHVGDDQVYYYVPAYFACDWDYDAKRLVAPLTDALRAEIAAAIGTCRACGLLR